MLIEERGPFCVDLALQHAGRVVLRIEDVVGRVFFLVSFTYTKLASLGDTSSTVYTPNPKRALLRPCQLNRTASRLFQKHYLKASWLLFHEFVLRRDI